MPKNLENTFNEINLIDKKSLEAFTILKNPLMLGVR